MTGLSDSFQRPVDYLRISVTDRCNLRCIYCMPAEGINLLPHEDVLSYEEIYRIAVTAAELGIKKVRITGGEPLVRIGLSSLIRMLAQIDAIDDIDLTTNGTLLAQYADELKAAGLVGIEAYYNSYIADEIGRLVSLAERYNLIATGGSDYHGLDDTNETMIGGVEVPMETAERLIALAEYRSQHREGGHGY